MPHVVGLKKQPGHGTADNGEFALEAAKDLTDLEERGFDRFGDAIGIVGSRLWVRR
ncbi:hypothetical protein NKH45_29395 [Mesorhizobium sp. M1156]|uniref:hypothetical protein n=1 Tax=Mesorhizobium sp. M1156 TaxID=2957064 RepID=UPI00333DD010